MRLLSNVEDMYTGDARRDAMNRDVYGHVDAALNAIDRFEMDYSSRDDLNGANVLNVDEREQVDFNNDAEHDHLNERPFDGVGATVNLGRNEEADIMAIHHHEDSNIV